MVDNEKHHSHNLPSGTIAPHPSSRTSPARRTRSGRSWGRLAPTVPGSCCSSRPAGRPGLRRRERRARLPPGFQGQVLWSEGGRRPRWASAAGISACPAEHLCCRCVWGSWAWEIEDGLGFRLIRVRFKFSNKRSSQIKSRSLSRFLYNILPDII